jgi:hypothetical protein
MITTAALALLLAFTNWEVIDTAGTSARVVRIDDAVTLQIQAADPGAHLRGLRMKTAGLAKRRNDPRQAVTGYVLDRGIFTAWRFVGSPGPDSLTFGAQGHIISKRNGGVVDFGRDRVRDTFTFTNRIDVERCSQKHGFRCHPLNHLQKVVIKNFGPEDVIDLQGRRYGYRDVRNGLLPDVPGDRLRVELLPPNS